MKITSASGGKLSVCVALSLLASCAHRHWAPDGPQESRTFYDVRRYGAVGDGKAIDSPAIDRAIIACTKAGGGTVSVPPGTYLCGSIHLASNVNLCLDPGATILGAPQDAKVYDPEEPFDGGAFQDEGHTYFHNSLIWGEHLTDVSITGKGRIDGAD